MKEKMKYFYSVILCCVTITIKAQINVPNLNLQQELEFEHLIYDNSSNLDITNKFIFEKATFLKNNKQYPKAIETLLRINENQLTDSIKYMLYYQLSILYFLNSNYEEVELTLNKINYFLTDSSYKSKLVLLQILNLNCSEKWEEGKKLLLNQLNNKTDSNLINDWYTKAFRFKPKKVKTAQAWQTFLPGTGHVYVGKTLHGVINASLILTGLVWGGFNTFNSYYATGLFSGFLFSYVFYKGGVEYAISNVDRFNKTKTNEINSELNTKIISFFQQQKSPNN